MKVILLERVERLGVLGDVVNVKDGFARNFLLPRSKALRATSANLKVFEGRDALNAYAKLLRVEPPLLWTVRLILLASVGLHLA